MPFSYLTSSSIIGRFFTTNKLIHTRRLFSAATMVASSSSAAAVKSRILADDEQFSERPVDYEGLKLRVIELGNGVRAVLTSDQHTTQSGLTIRVDHGSLNDPDEFEGLAHFVEHLTTMGSQKYPNENEYSSFISDNGGFSNAYTSLEDTVYYHTIKNACFEKSVDILSQIIIEPLFKPDSVSREVLAVDSEYKMQMNAAFFPSMHISKLMLDQHHPMAKFDFGNLESLRGDRSDNEMAEAAKNFHGTYYGPKNLKVSFYGNLSLDELQSMAENYFGILKPRNTEPELLVETPVKLNNEHISAVYTIPSEDIKKMSFSWFFKEETKKLGIILCRILSNRNEGTLFHLLKEKNLILDLSTYSYSQFVGTKQLDLDLDLTDFGVEHCTEIIEIINQYLQFLKLNQIPQYIFDELKISGHLAFKGSNRGQIDDYCNNIATSLHKYPVDKLLTHGIDYADYSIEKEKDLINQMNLENCIIIVKSMKFNDQKFGIDKIEKYSKARYTVKDINLKKATNYLSAFKFPEKNKYLTDKFDLKSIDEFRPNFESFEFKNQNIDGIYHSSITEAKYRKEFVFADIRMRNFCIQNSAENELALKTLIKYLNDCMDTKFYDANVSNIEFEFAAIKHGIKIFLAMPPSKILETSFLKDFLHDFFSFKPDLTKLKPFAAKMEQDVNNLLSQKPFSVARRNFKDIISNSVPVFDLIKKVDTIHSADYDKLLPSYFDNLSIDVLTFGTRDHKYGAKIVDALKDAMLAKNINFSNHGSLNNFNMLMPGPNFKIESTLVSANDKLNNALYVSIPFKKKSITDTLAVMIYDQFFEDQFFDELRTKQNFGYMVHHRCMDEPEMVGLNFVIQSERSYGDIQSAISKFIYDTMPILKNKTENEWAECLDAIKTSLLNDPKSIYDDFSTIQSNNYVSKYKLTKHNFDYKANLVHGLQNITRDQVINFLESNIKDDSIERMITVKCLKSE